MPQNHSPISSIREDDSEQESSDESHTSRECHMVQITPVMIRDETTPKVPPAGPVPNGELMQDNPVPPTDLEQLRFLQERSRELDDVR